MTQTVLCPACNKVIAVKGIPKHTNGCPEWAAKINVPPSLFNFDRHYKRNLYADGLVEGEDYILCLLCSGNHRARRLADHLKIMHSMALSDYQKQFPESSTCALKSLAARKTTVQAKYGMDNVAKVPEVRVLLRERNRSTAPEVAAKRAATNKLRYGSENPFGSPEVQKRIRVTLESRYGASNPQQVPEIRNRTLATNVRRYGTKHYPETEEFQDKFRASSQKRFGTDHPMRSEAGRGLWVEGIRSRLGVDNPLSDPVIWAKSYQTNLANHGGKHSQQTPEVLEKARRTWFEKYGVDNPSKTEEVKNRIKEVWLGKYGVPFPPQSLWTNRKQTFPNKMEQALQVLCPVNVIYTGDGSYWVRAPGESKARNPDFVVLSASQLEAWRSGMDINSLRSYAVVEAFGDYWHGPKFTGIDRDIHRDSVLDYYRRAGLVCLIVWESEIKGNPKAVSERLAAFLRDCGRFLGAEDNP